MEIKYNLSLPKLMDFFCCKKHEGFTLEEIEAAEKRLGVMLPKAYREFLMAYGKDEVNYHFNQLEEPENICSSYELIHMELDDRGEEFQEAEENGSTDEYADDPYFKLCKMPEERWGEITEEYILIWYENQSVWSAGYRKEDLLNGANDLPVYISTNDDYITYGKCADNTEDFLTEMLRQAAYGWKGGGRFTKADEIDRILLEAGIDKDLLKVGNGSCLCEDHLYFYSEFDDYGELMIANRTYPKAEMQQKAIEALSSVKKYEPKYGPRRLAWLPTSIPAFFTPKAKPENGIPLNPVIFEQLQKTFNHKPSTAYDINKDISKIKSLTINISDNRSNDFIFINFAAYTNDCEDYRLPAPYYYDIDDWSAIGLMTNLKSLVIHHLFINDFSFLKNCKNLRSLSLYNTNFSDCRFIVELPNLKEADLRFCPLEHTEVLQNSSAKILT